MAIQNLILLNKMVWGSPTLQAAFKVEKFAVDGYTLRASQGINNRSETWPCTWTALTPLEARNLKQLFDSQSGVELIAWQTPLSTVTRHFTVEQYNFEPLPGKTEAYRCTASLIMQYA